MTDCLFCKIVNGEIEKEFLYKDEEVVVFDDIYPKAPVHILIVPKKHIESVNKLKEEDKSLVGKMFLVAKDLAGEKGLKDKGFRLILNTGRDAGQTVDHLHLHLMGGEKLPFA
ncbi:MAG: histidine triad nucleotide-binding protein [Candidatus Nealsonbacteria bacterium]